MSSFMLKCSNVLFLHFDTRNYVLSVGAAGGLLALLSTGSQ